MSRHISGRMAPALCFLLVFLGASAAGADELAPGMSLREARKVMRSETGRSDARFIETICSIPLGLDVFGGATFYTMDTDVTMHKALDFPALFGLDGQVLGFREQIETLDAFVALKTRFPSGRFFLHVFPNDTRTTRVFQAATESLYVFTNRNHDLYVLDRAMREQVVAGLSGSFCWHSKLLSPNLDGFKDEYLACVERDGPYGDELLDQDLERCRAYCDQTPENYASQDCPGNCRQAREEASGISSRPLEQEVSSR